MINEYTLNLLALNIVILLITTLFYLKKLNIVFSSHNNPLKLDMEDLEYAQLRYCQQIRYARSRECYV